MNHSRLLWLAAPLIVGLASCAPTALRSTTQFIPMLPVGQLANKNGIGGYAEITPYSNGRSEIVVRIGNLPPETVRAGSIVYGNCDKWAPNAFFKLEPMSSERNGVGTATSWIETDKLSATTNTKAPLAILYYQRSETDRNGIGDPIICGAFQYRAGDAPPPSR
jgi:hypothetical protein